MKPVILCVLLMIVLAAVAYFGYNYCSEYMKDVHPAVLGIPPTVFQ